MNSYLDIENKILEYERLDKLSRIYNSSSPFFNEDRLKSHDEKNLLLSEIHQQYKYFKTDIEQDVELSKHIRDFISNTGVQNLINTAVQNPKKQKPNSIN